jgi:hypothetical protein
MVVVVAAVVVVVVGGGGGARAAGRWARCLGIAFFCFIKISFAESFPTLGTPVTRGSDVAPGKEAFAGPAAPRALCREGLGLCQEHCTLGKAIESGSVFSSIASLSRQRTNINTQFVTFVCRILVVRTVEKKLRHTNGYHFIRPVARDIISFFCF